MAYEDVGEIPVADTLEPPFDSVEEVARQLMLDAINPVPLGTFPAEVQGTDDRTWMRAEHVLDGDDLNELPTLSRYLSVTLDPEGIQVAVMPFSEAGKITIPGTASDTQPDVESVPLGETGRLVCVDFFSILLEKAGVRLEGMQTDASAEEVGMLAETLTHPELKELATSHQQFKYMAPGFVVMKGSLARREAARLEFLERKAGPAIQVGVDNVELLIEREKEVRRRERR